MANKEKENVTKKKTTTTRKSTATKTTGAKKTTTKTTAKKAPAKKVAAKEKEVKVVKEKNIGSILKNLKIEKEANGRLSFTKIGLIIYLIIAVLLIGCAFVVGNKVDVKNPFAQTEEQVQAKIEKNLEKEIAKINEKLPDGDKLESKATYSTEGTVNNYNYYQYMAYTESTNAYMAWIVNSEDGKILAVWTSEQHKKGSESISQKILTEIIDDLYKDKVTDSQRKDIKKYAKTQEEQTIQDTDFAYIQQFATDGLGEDFDYAAIYELDFFTYVPESSSTDTATTDDTVDVTTTAEEDAK